MNKKRINSACPKVAGLNVIASDRRERGNLIIYVIAWSVATR